ncbi:MAG: hypothetical protein PHV20_04115 [Bacteroidales bacterium]|nr:hypothetical protein [Bacteroidales bacterium]
MFKLSFLVAILFVSLNVLSQSPHGPRLSIKCEVCHTPNSWAFNSKGSAFDHSQTGFQLVGQHKMIDCRKCHVDLVFSNAKMDCNSCHTDVHQQTVGNDCARCHTPQTWVVSNITQLHRQTRFPLDGSHAKVDCYQCHKSSSLLRFDPMGTECVSCHLKDYQATTNPSHVQGKFPQNCTECHTDKSWKNATFDHNVNTGFPLKNAHFGVDCISCHASGYKGTSTACVSCHQKDYNATTAPAHAAAKFSTDCQTCHTDISWKPSTFNHNVSTTFPIKGAHVGVDCISCHGQGFVGTSKECVSCHQTNFNATTNPSHTLAKFSTECLTCHTENGWKPSTFNHSTATTFPLKGGHIGLDCNSCHSKGFVGTSKECVDCHLDKYNATTNPSHIASKFPKDCKLCHSENSWQGSTFDHSTTGFPLKGSHSSLDCKQCHSAGYIGTPTACVSCHKSNYDATVNPNHVAAKFSTDCQSCHNESSWKPSSFNHDVNTSFKLNGSHKGVDCISCHKGGVFAGTPSTCVSCHKSNFDATVNPSHSAAKFSTECQTCHTESAWQPSTFNHDVNTSFKLNGSHKGVDCISCHKGGVFAGTQSTCVSCHLDKYNSTISPAHAAAKFSTECQTCHTETAWKPSTFNHNTSTSFPLKGSHTTVDCIGCHAGGFVGTAKDCVSCHLANYNAATNPNHVNAKFAKECQTCHSETAWSPSTFNHNTATTFPLTGRHIGVDCISCHSQGYKGISTACSSCHMTDYNRAANHVASKFPTTCETCHTVNGWTPSTFNHDSQYFRIYSGKHKGRWSLCSECHTSSGNFGSFTCIVCHEHSNKASVDKDHSGVSGYVYNGTSCYSCHRNI